MLNNLDSEKTCAGCLLFHPDETTEGTEAGQTGTIITRKNPAIEGQQYGRLGCFNDIYGGLSGTVCTVPDKFKPRS